MGVEGTDIERQLGAQQLEETQDVIDRLGHGVGDQVDAAAAELGQGRGARLVPVADRDGVGGAAPDADQAGQPPAGGPRLAQHVAGAGVPVSEPGADQDPAGELELLQVVGHQGEVIVAELLGDHGEEPGEPVRAELAGVVVRDGPQLAERGQEQLHHLHAAVQDRLGVLGHQPPPDALLGQDRRRGDVVDVPHDRGLGQAVAQHLLPVGDRLRFRRAVQQRADGDVTQENVLCGHGVQQSGQFQVLDQRRRAGRELLLGVEITGRMHEVGLHDPTRPWSWS